MIMIFVSWFLADFLSGVVHWIEDRYMDGNHRSEFARGIATDNIQHHIDPTAMVRSTFWENIRSSVMFTVPLTIILIWLGCPVVIWLAVLFSSLGNGIHRFSHMPKRQVHRAIRGMQEWGLFISPKHHSEHHYAMGLKVMKKDSNRRYCPMTDWVNPLADYFRIWSKFEYLLSKINIKTID